MTINLTYLNDLSRVRVDLSDLSPVGEDSIVRLEHSPNNMLWGTVRGSMNLEVPAVGSVQVDDYEFFPDVTTFYRTVPIDPVAGLVLAGVSGDYASTPDSPGLDITGDIVLRAEVTLDDYNPGVEQALVAKYDSVSDDRSYMLIISSAGQLRMNWSEDGSTPMAADSSVLLETMAVNGERIAVEAWLNVDVGGTDHAVTFYTAPTFSGPWSQLGTQQVNAGVTSIHNSGADLEVGAYSGGTQGLAEGTVHAVQVWEGTLSGGELDTGTMRASPAFEDQPGGSTSFDDAQGNTWSINGNATLVGVETASIVVNFEEGEYWLKSIRWPFLNRRVQPVYREAQRQSRNQTFAVSGRSVPDNVSDLRMSKQFPINLVTHTLEEARNLDLLLAGGDVMLLHVPATQDLEGCGPVPFVPGGYVVAGTTTMMRTVLGARENLFTLPLTIVARPSPQIIGSTMTWQGVYELFGDSSWLPVLSANPTWRSLLDTVADPESVVVL